MTIDFSTLLELDASDLNALVPQVDSKACSANLGLVAAVTDLAGTTITLTSKTTNAVAFVAAHVRLDKAASASGAIAICRINVDGTDYNMPPISTSVSGGLYGTAGSVAVPLLTAAAHTFKIRASCSTSAIWTATATDSRISVLMIG